MMATRQLPTKPSGDTAIKPVRRKGPTKSARAPALKRVKGRKAKPRVDAAQKRAAVRTARAGARGEGPPDLGEQRPAKRAKPLERYVRLRVRVEDGELSIVDSHMVEGPLAQGPAFEAGHAYEVTDGDRLLHAGSIPDLGVVRSFAYADGTLEQQTHHTYELPTYEFNARVPAAVLTRAALPKIAVALYRVKERPVARAALPQTPSAPLDVERARELREVGRVVGLPTSVLGSLSTARSARPAARRKAAKRRAAKPSAKKR
jgi:hypothetical protein